MPWFYSPQGDGWWDDVKTIASFDPGGSTGWATAEYTPQFNKWKFQSGTFDMEKHHLKLWDFLTMFSPDLVIYEDFNSEHPDFARSVELISRNYIGVIELYSISLEIPSLRSSLSNKSFWSDDKMSRVLVGMPKTIHARDAMRHLLHFMTFKAPNPVQDLLLPLRPTSDPR